MSKLDEIQMMIHSLDKQEIARLREWFDEFEGDMWDRDFDADAKDKKFDKHADAGKKQNSEGNSKEV